MVPMSEGEHWSDIEAIGALAEPVRRELYRYVADREGVSRDEAAGAVGVSRALAAFHLDKLVERGLLRAAYRRRAGKTGPGAGRPAKVYWRSDRAVDVTLPRRRHALLSELLAESLAAVAPRDEIGADGGPLSAAARAAGVRLGSWARRARRGRAGHRQVREALERPLSELGLPPDCSGQGGILL